MKTTTARGYGYAHQQARARWQPIVEAGQAYCTEPLCLMPSRWIDPRYAWDLAHGDNRTSYRGPAHIRCNRSEGARRGNRTRGRKRRAWQL